MYASGNGSGGGAGGGSISEAPNASTSNGDPTSSWTGDPDNELRDLLRNIGQSNMPMFPDFAPPLADHHLPTALPTTTITSPAAPAPVSASRAVHEPIHSGAQIEDLASWGDITFFVSLHSRYQHALVPLCHQPTFARDLLYRRDERDETFRCFLYSLGELRI